MILDEIFAKCKADLKRIKSEIPFTIVEQKAEQNAKFKARNPQKVRENLRKNTKKLNIIAEVKKASPSKGVIRANFAPLKIATNYAQNGAAAISVLTERHYFQGDLAFLRDISDEFQNAQNLKSQNSVQIPLLRKDFIFDEYQILQSLANGADFILLIARMFDKEELLKLVEFAKNLQLEILCEIHSEEDLEKAVFAGAQIIGVNHRDLNDFSMDLKLCEKLMPKMPKDALIVAESGLDDKSTMLNLDALGVDAFLVGEYLMRQSDEGAALRNLTERI